MALEIKPIHFIDLGNIKCERRYQVVELGEDPLSIPNDWDQSSQQELQEREKCEGFQIIDMDNMNKTTDDSDSSDMEEFTVYPSNKQDLTSTTGIATVIRSILTNKSKSEEVNKFFAKVDLGDDYTFSSMESYTEFSDTSYSQGNNSNNPKNEICNISGDLQNTLLENVKPNENCYTIEDKNCSHEKLQIRYQSNSSSNTSNRGEKPCQTESINKLTHQNQNFEPISLNKSVTITPLIHNHQPRFGSNFNAQDKQNSFNEEEPFFSRYTKVTIPTASNNVHQDYRFSSNSPSIVSNNNYCNSNHVKSKPVCKRADLDQRPVAMKTSTHSLLSYNELNYQHANVQDQNTLQSNQKDFTSLQSYRQESAFARKEQYENELSQFINSINDSCSNSLYEPSTFPFDNSAVHSSSHLNKKYMHSKINVSRKNCVNENTIDKTINLEDKTPTTVKMIQQINPTSTVIPCVHCRFKTTDFHDWFVHNKSCHKTISVVCPFCGYRQSKKPYMQIHVCSVHLGYKPYSCHICQFSTAWKSYLKIHLSKHNEGL